MMTLLAATVLLGVIITALYTFGIFNTPYTHAFRFGFYFFVDRRSRGGSSRNGSTSIRWV